MFLNGELDLGKAKTHYDGSYPDGTPAEDTTDNTWFDGVCRGGLQLSWGDSEWKLYTGLGLYSWTRILGTEKDNGYREVYTWFYLPVGFSVDYYFSENVSLGLDAGIKQMLAGTIGIWFDPDATGDPNFRLQLGNRLGYYYSVPLKVHVDEFTLTCAPYLEYRPIGKSTTGEGFDPLYGYYEIYEPSSTAYCKGVKLWAGYSF